MYIILLIMNKTYLYISIALLIVLAIVSYNSWKKSQALMNAADVNQNGTRTAGEAIEAMAQELSKSTKTVTINV